MAERKYLTQRKAEDMLRLPGHRLMLMHTNGGDGECYYIVPGGPVEREVAEKIIARADAHASSDGLFPGCNQTWRLGSAA